MWRLGSCRCEELVDELDLAANASIFVVYVAAFDCSDRLNPAQCCFG